MKTHILSHDGGTASVARCVDRALALSPQPGALFLFGSRFLLSAFSRLAQHRLVIGRDIHVLCRDSDPYFDAIVPSIAHYQRDIARFNKGLLRLLRDGLGRSGGVQGRRLAWQASVKMSAARMTLAGNAQFGSFFLPNTPALNCTDAGFHDFVGITYNYAAPLFHRLRAAWTCGDRPECERLLRLVGELLDLILSLPGFSGQKMLMKISGFDCGPSPCPLPSVTPDIEKKAETVFFEILRRATEPATAS